MRAGTSWQSPLHPVLHPLDAENRTVNYSSAAYTMSKAMQLLRKQEPRADVFVDTPAIEALSRARAADANAESLVFCTDRGTAFNPNNVRNRVLVSACKRAKNPQVSWHNFRYTYSTWTNPSGESIKALQAQLGHTDSRLTLSVYTQPMLEAQKLLACKISSVLLRSAPKSEVQRAEAEVVIPCLAKV